MSNTPDIDELGHLDVRHFKLVSGEDIIGFVLKKSDDLSKYVVEQPYLVEVEGGRFSAKPWFQLSEQTLFNIKKDHIIQSSIVSNFIKERFIEMVCDDYGIEYGDVEPTDALDESFDESFDSDPSGLYVPDKKLVH